MQLLPRCAKNRRSQEKEVSRLRYTFRERITAVGIIIVTGLLFNFSLLLDTTVSVAHDFFDELLPSVHMVVVNLINRTFSILVVTGWFTILYKILPDAKIDWKVAGTGGFVTAVLFNTGKFILGKLLVYSTVVTIFGASASLALVLLFIFYASLILYFGAAFTFVFAEGIGKPVTAGKYSDRYELRVIARDKD